MNDKRVALLLIKALEEWTTENLTDEMAVAFEGITLLGGSWRVSLTRVAPDPDPESDE